MDDDKKAGRDKIFDEKKPVNISGDILKLVAEDGERRRLYSSQVIDEILRTHFTNEGRL